MAVNVLVFIGFYFDPDSRAMPTAVSYALLFIVYLSGALALLNYQGNFSQRSLNFFDIH